MQNFYQHQDEARGMTKALCYLLVFAVVGTIIVSEVALAGVAVASSQTYLSATTSIKMPFAHWRDIFLDRLLQALVLTTLAVVAVAIYKSLQLAEGGGRLVATSLGGTRVLDGTEDLGHRKVLNVVEEMAIATGTRTPAVYVLEDEPGINAFAAGYEAKDTAIGVTRGAIDRLKRHQLQGIIAHEFGHIVEGDVRLNVRLIGVLSGIQSIPFAAQHLIRIAASPSKNSRSSIGTGNNPLGMALALIFGLALWPIGQVGALFAMLINLAVNRQREFLADASAVQYTRDPHGLCEALELLRDDEIGSRIQGPAAQLAAHMFFAGVGNWQRLFRTHPPLDERIRRLHPQAGMPPATKLSDSAFTAQRSATTSDPALMDPPTDSSGEPADLCLTGECR